MSQPLSARARAGLSGGFSGGREYYEFAVRGFEAALIGCSVLDFGCGTGGFGTFLVDRFSVRPDGVDVVRHKGVSEANYSSFQIADLDSLATSGLAGAWDFIFALGLIEYLTNPRRFISSAAALLKSGGRLVITSPNPASLRSVVALLRSGEFSTFKETWNPASITPVLAPDATRMFRESGLVQVEKDWSARGVAPGGLTWQRLVPPARGRWFSDNLRVIGAKPATAVEQG